MAKAEARTKRHIEEFIAGCQVAWAVITVPTVLASALTTAMRIDPASGIVPLFGWIVRFYQENFYAQVQALPFLNQIPTWVFDILLVVLIVASLWATYSMRIANEQKRLEAEEDGIEPPNDNEGAKIAIAATAAGAIATAGLATGVFDVLGAAMGIPFVGTLALGALALIRGGSNPSAKTVASQSAARAEQRRMMIARKMDNFRKRERAIFLVATILSTALVAANFAFRVTNTAASTPHSSHAMCVTRHQPGEQCSCERAPTTFGTASAAESGLHNVCKIPD